MGSMGALASFEDDGLVSNAVIVKHREHKPKPHTKTRVAMVKLLSHLEECSGDGSLCVCTSRRLMGVKLHMSLAELRTATAALVDADFLHAVQRFRDDGGQMENGYVVTDSGRTFLAENKHLLDENVITG